MADQKCVVAVLPEMQLFLRNVISIFQFHIFRADRLNRYGGVSIVIHRTIKVKPIDIRDNLKVVFFDNFIDLVGVDIFSNSVNSTEIWFIFIYPSSALLSKLFLKCLV